MRFAYDAPLNSPQRLKDSDWEKINGKNWAGLLKWQPQLASHCAWGKLDGYDWAKLLAARSEFAEICDWSKTNSWSGTDWAMLICNAPEYVTDARLDKMEGKDLVVVLSKQPQFAERCDFRRLCGDDWVELLTVQPCYADRCDWAKLNNSNWLTLLKKQPQFAEKRDWKSVSGIELVYELANAPEFEEYYDFEKLYESTGSGDDRHILFAEVLANKHGYTLGHGIYKNQYEWGRRYRDKCDWERFSDQDLKWLMRWYLGYVEKIILSERHVGRRKLHQVKEVVKKDVDWNDLSGDEIVRLLKAFPRLSNKCDLTKLTVQNWVDLLESRPEFQESCLHLQNEIETEMRQRRLES